ncbi:hypothetical protein [Paracoccus haematequi]|nr:hypothetical protein [Paracoccus haematequi]
MAAIGGAYAAGAEAAGAAPVLTHTTLADQILHHVAEIERLLQDAAPEGVELTSVCWRVGADDFWASGDWIDPVDPRFYKLAHFRPQHRPDWWVQGMEGGEAA